MNLPNKLTLLRVCLIPVFVVFARMTPFWAQCVAVAVYGIACLTDMLDGRIARARNLSTNFGYLFVNKLICKLFCGNTSHTIRSYI